jgi:hypothetical protein
MLWLDLAVGRGLEAFVLPNAGFCSGRLNEMRAQRATDCAPDCSKHRSAAFLIAR